VSCGIAEAALVTVPLGVLKAGSIRFQPPLPPRKQDAIARMGFGILNKVSRMSYWPVSQHAQVKQYMLRMLSCPCSSK
jgi:Flavin containing amine oxidoreductase